MLDYLCKNPHLQKPKNKTMKKHFYAAIALVLTLASCSTTQQTTETITQTLDYMESSVRVLEPDHNMLLTPLIADLKVSSERVKYTEKEMFANLEVTNVLLSNIAELKKIALSRAAQAYNADVLVGSTIDIITKNERLEITVSGYPAHYVNFRNTDKKDIELLKDIYGIKTANGAEILNSPASRLEIKQVEEE